MNSDQKTLDAEELSTADMILIETLNDATASIKDLTKDLTYLSSANTSDLPPPMNPPSEITQILSDLKNFSSTLTKDTLAHNNFSKPLLNFSLALTNFSSAYLKLPSTLTDETLKTLNEILTPIKSQLVLINQNT